MSYYMKLAEASAYQENFTSRAEMQAAYYQ